jgi:hypothetical protein
MSASERKPGKNGKSFNNSLSGAMSNLRNSDKPDVQGGRHDVADPMNRFFDAPPAPTTIPEFEKKMSDRHKGVF